MGPLRYDTSGANGASGRGKNTIVFADKGNGNCLAGNRVCVRNKLFFYVARQMTALTFDIKAKELSAPVRGSKRIARARHIAMYLMHTSFSLSYVEIARLFNRDRSTVSYACKTIEELRDVPSVDDKLLEMEKILMIVMQLASRNRE